MSSPAHDHDHDHHDEDHHRGLAFDVNTVLARRRALQMIGGVGLLALVGCSSSGSDGATTSTSAAASTTGAAGGASTTAGSSDGSGSTDAIPEETAGPYPGDGSNGPDVLSESGVVRSDITTSFAGSSGTAEGVPLTMSFVVAEAATGQAMSGAAVYAWHCTRDGGYSMYSSGLEDQNFLRGVQETGSDGSVTFQTIFPGAYDGRWPHVHFEVYESVDAATNGGEPIATSQLAFSEDICNEVYQEDGYEQSVSNLSRTSLESDMIFSDGYEQQLGTMSGSVGSNLTVTLPVPV